MVIGNGLVARRFELYNSEEVSCVCFGVVKFEDQKTRSIQPGNETA